MNAVQIADAKAINTALLLNNKEQQKVLTTIQNLIIKMRNELEQTNERIEPRRTLSLEHVTDGNVNGVAVSNCA